MRCSLGAPRGGAAGVGRPGVHPAGREAAPFVRVTEPCLRAVQLLRRRRRGTGCDHLGRRRPLPRRRGGISLKEAGTSLFPGSGRRALGGRGGGAGTQPLPPAHSRPGGRAHWLLVGSRDPVGAHQRGGGRGEPEPGLTAKTAVPSRPDCQPVFGPPVSGLSDPGTHFLTASPGLPVTQRPAPIGPSVTQIRKHQPEPIIPSSPIYSASIICQ